MKSKLLFILVALFSFQNDLWAQCAMCKTSIVNNVSNGELALAEGLNFGIIYLFVTPYLAIMAIGGIWYFKYKKHGREKHGASTLEV